MSEDELHRQLRRLLRKEGIDRGAAPDQAQWEGLIARLDRSFLQFTRDRYMLERSLEISSTEAQQLHDALIEDRERLHAVVAALPQAVIELDPTLCVRSANPVGETWVGAKPGAELGSLLRFEGNGGRTVSVEELASRVREERFTTGDGAVWIGDERVPAAWDLAPILVRGSFVGAVCVITDLRTVKSREIALREARVDAAVAVQAEQARGRFLANMSHELRTPLNAILGYTEMVRDELEQSEAREDLGRVLEAAGYLLRLINDLLDISKVDAGKLELVPEWFELNALLTQLATTATPLMGPNENRLEIQASDGRVFQDRTRLAQSVLNLVANAARFTEQGTISITAEIEADWLEVVVADTGTGIAPDRLELLFDEFEQGDPRVALERGGTGLGLSLTRRFVELMGGEIQVASEVDEGSEFIIRVPQRFRA